MPRVFSAVSDTERRVSGVSFLDRLPYPLLIIAAVLPALAPFQPMLHIVEKVIMLNEGTLSKPIDTFDRFFHLTLTTRLNAYLESAR